MSFEEVLHAQRRLVSYIHRTPVHCSATVDKMCGRKVYFKCENLQKTGSFKARGALNAVSKEIIANTDVKHTGYLKKHAYSSKVKSSWRKMSASLSKMSI